MPPARRARISKARPRTCMWGETASRLLPAGQRDSSARTGWAAAWGGISKSWSSAASVITSCVTSSRGIVTSPIVVRSSRSRPSGV